MRAPNGTQSAPVTQPRNGGAIGTRNGDYLAGMTLAQLEARLAAQDRALSGNVLPKLLEARRRQHAASKDDRSCGRCGEPFEGGRTAYLLGLALGRRHERWQAPECEECAPSYTKNDNPHHDVGRGSCDICSRPLVWEWTGRDWYRRHSFCSERCRWTHYNGLRDERNARAREKACEVCGEPFMAARRDAKTCSSACRQKAYRQRRGAA